MLLNRGLTPLSAQVCSEFATQAIALYWSAAEMLLQPGRWAQFIMKNGALGKVRKSGPNAGLQVPIEDAITSEIGCIVQELRKRLPPDHFLRQYEAHFEFEAPVPDTSRTGRHMKSADHRVTSGILNGPELVIEAKPLESKTDVTKRYLAADGIGCFLGSDSPYSRGPLGAMWAYTMSSTGTSFQSDVLLGLQNFKPVVAGIDRIVGVHTGKPTWEIDCSHHDRTQAKLRPISLLHLEFVFPCQRPIAPAKTIKAGRS